MQIDSKTSLWFKWCWPWWSNTPLDIKVSFWPHTTLRQLLTRPKDHVQEKKQTGVVYQVPCVGCPATYMGQTSRHLDQWLF